MNPQPSTPEALADFLLERIGQVQKELAWTGSPADQAEAQVAEVLDSMGLAELLVILAEECGTTPEAIEACTGRRFGTVRELAASLHAAGLVPRTPKPAQAGSELPRPKSCGCWLSGASLFLPDRVQSAAEIDARVGRPAGWLEKHAGIRQRRLWGDQDPLEGAARAGRTALETSGMTANALGALLLTSEAPPLLAGLAAAVHERLGLKPTLAALEVGGACTGFLAGLYLAKNLATRVGPVLLIALEAASKYLRVEPGPAGEAAALFGDAAAACLVSPAPASSQAVPLVDVVLGADGQGSHLLRLPYEPGRPLHLEMEGPALAGRAVRTMARACQDLLQRHGLTLDQVQGVVAHGGNGRMPVLLARILEVPADYVWSETPNTGNLGSACLPAAWATRGPVPGPILWTAVGAGLTWGAALTGEV